MALPPNPTAKDIMQEARDICQSAKEVQNLDRAWSDEHWRRISKAIERIEEATSPKA